MNYTDELKNRIIDWGASLVGIADVSKLGGLEVFPTDLLAPFSSAISVALRIPSETFEQISTAPTPIYANVYQTANRMLDEIAFKAALALQADGYADLEAGLRLLQPRRPEPVDGLR